MHRIDLDYAEIGAHIMTITDALPAPIDVERVRAKLAAYGWPLDDPLRDTGDAEYAFSALSPSHRRVARCRFLRFSTESSTAAGSHWPHTGRRSPPYERLTGALRVGGTSTTTSPW